MALQFHEPVLVEEVLGFLLTDITRIYVDGTLGGGGHAEKICERLAGQGRLLCFDVDDDALRFARQRLERFQGRITFVRSDYGNVREELHALGIGSVAGILLDLGVSSFQLDEAERGFSFRGDAALDMRMDRRRTLTAGDVVNGYDEQHLAALIREYGEERNARRIAKRIVLSRPMRTTGELAGAVRRAVGGRFLTKTLARVFQAIRIEVNGELDSLRRALAGATELLMPGGRIVVIAYQSLEDRMVKEFFRREAGGDPGLQEAPRVRVLTKKVIRAGEEEMKRNPRARSAKLRAAERLPAGWENLA